MNESSYYTAYASLAAVGVAFQHLRIWPTVTRQVKIKQKVRTYTPLQKLQDCFITMLAGGAGLVEINTRLRPDRGLQRAFGRHGCAEQSTISDTLNACTEENVRQLRAVLCALVQHYGQAPCHNYRTRWQLLDIDMTGLVAGRQGEGVTKGYFPSRKNARGRQLGRVIATDYDEILTEQLFPGKRQLEGSLRDLVESTAHTLALDEKRRENTLLRIDGGGGSDANIQALLARGYQVLIKAHSWQRSRKAATSVKHWQRDPKVPEREVGWVGAPHDYGRATQQVAVRKRKANGQWLHSVIVSTVSDRELRRLNHLPRSTKIRARQRALLIVYAYDFRGGGAETQNKGDKQGLGLGKRNKRQFAAQEMLVLLAQLAHNWVIWSRNALAPSAPALARYGIQRMVRDVFRIPGSIRFDAVGKVHITLRQEHPLARCVLSGLQHWLPHDELSANLGKI